MKRRLMLLSMAIIGLVLTASAINYNGAHFQGIGKVAGKPLDFWVDIEMDDEEADFNIGNINKLTAEYKAGGTTSKPTFSVQVPRSTAAVFKSDDGGESYTGTIKINGLTIDLWFLKVPRKLKPSQLTDEELNKIISSPDGYTCFAQLETQGILACVTADFTFDDGHFDMQCDSSEIQKMFSNFNGTYSIENGQLNLVAAVGTKLTGKIYDNGKYLVVPVGSKGGMTLKLILIR